MGKVSHLQDEKGSGDWLYNNVNVTPLNCTSKMVKMVNIVMCFSSQLKEEKSL